LAVFSCELKGGIVKLTGRPKTSVAKKKTAKYSWVIFFLCLCASVSLTGQSELKRLSLTSKSSPYDMLM
jgi:hypothetical protein